jgi:hypothetical protein
MNIVFTTKDTKSTKFGVLVIQTLRVLRLAIVESLRGLRKFPGVEDFSDLDIPPAKHVLSLVEGTQRRQVRNRFFPFAYFAVKFPSPNLPYSM